MSGGSSVVDGFIPIWWQAYQQPAGLLLRTSDPAKARVQLYAARRLAQAPELANLQIMFSPFPDGDLVICHKGPVKLAELTPGAAQAGEAPDEPEGPTSPASPARLDL